MKTLNKKEILWGAKRLSGDGEVIIHFEIDGSKRILSIDGISEEGSSNYDAAVERAESDEFAYSLSDDACVEILEEIQ